MENSNKSWADLVHENKKTIKIILFSILGILLLIISSTLFLVIKGYDVSTSGITKQKEKQDSLTTKNREKNITETKKETIVIPKKIIEYRDRYRNVPKETITIEKPSTNITSTGQSGGITAQNVNIGKVVPELNENLKKSLIEAFPDKNEKIDLSYLIGSSNRMDFANKIQVFMKNEGYKNINVGMMASDPEPKGISYDRKNGKTSLIVGVLE